MMNKQDLRFRTDLWREETIIFDAAGMAPKKYGPDVYRFYAALTLNVLAPKRGWTVLKCTSNYIYLKPPENWAGKPFSLVSKIPTQEQAIAIAEAFYADGTSWIGQLGEWPAWYIHEQQMVSYELGRDTKSGAIVKKHPQTTPLRSWLKIGESGLWQVRVDKKQDGFAAFGTGKIQEREVSVSLEGQEFTAQQTRYERSAAARMICIAHYGWACMVCGFDFGKTYGLIGKGYVQVHHIMPVSGRGGEYEVDPINDLVPLCANCHAMAHQREPPFSIAELKNILEC